LFLKKIIKKDYPKDGWTGADSMAARNAARHVVAAVSKTGLMPSGYQVRAAGLHTDPPFHQSSLCVRVQRLRQLRATEASERTRRKGC
jgi:hypothetical protein